MSARKYLQMSARAMGLVQSKNQRLLCKAIVIKIAAYFHGRLSASRNFHGQRPVYINRSDTCHFGHFNRS